MIKSPSSSYSSEGISISPPKQQKSLYFNIKMFPLVEYGIKIAPVSLKEEYQTLFNHKPVWSPFNILLSSSKIYNTFPLTVFLWIHFRLPLWITALDTYPFPVNSTMNKPLFLGIFDSWRTIWIWWFIHNKWRIFYYGKCY